jgi:hypothetical protein
VYFVAVYGCCVEDKHYGCILFLCCLYFEGIFVFVYLFIDTRWIPDTRLKPSGYGYDFLPVGTGMCTKFYP